MSHPLYRLAILCAVSATLSAPAAADPAVGFGLTITFGTGQPEVGAGVRVFSNDEEDQFATSLGLDYLFSSQAFRGSLGGAYLMNNSYVGLDGGYNFTTGTFGVGIGGGVVNTNQPPTAAPVEPLTPARDERD